MTTSPISTIIDHILLMIFKTITEPMPSWGETPRPLDHVQAASQVCQRWRGLFLDSTWIWGRVIDSEDIRFGPGRGKWIEEIIRRAGSSPLWIYGYVTKPEPDSGLFDSEALFIRLLESWERMEKLQVSIGGDKLSNDIQRHFLSRAPILKVFDVNVGSYQSSLFCSTFQPDSSQLLFADYAPSLVQINASDVVFKLDSPWLSNVRDINMPRRMTLQDVLTLLQHTPLLSVLSLEDTDVSCDLENPLFPKMFFSNLSIVDLGCKFLAVTATILDHVSPSKLSVARLNAWHEEIPNSYTLSALKRNLPSYITNYFTTNPATFIEFAFPGFSFLDQVPFIQVCTQDHFFEMKMPVYEEDIDLASCLLDTFLESSYRNGRPFLFQTVTKLKAILDSKDVMYTFQPDIFAKLYSMLAAFQCVRKLVIDEDSLKYFCSLSCLENQELVLFPQLVTVRLAYEYESDDGQSTVKYLLQFLLKRKEIGRPVARLDLTGYDPLEDGVRDFTVLDQVDGLEVVWKQKSESQPGVYEWREYICGTGMPERLNLDLDIRTM